MVERSTALKRQYVRVALIFAVLFVASFAGFTISLVRELSQGSLEDILVTGAGQGDGAAGRGVGRGPRYRVVEVRRETMAALSPSIAHREVVETVQVFDDRGKLVTQTSTYTEGTTGGFPDSGAELLQPRPSLGPPSVKENRREYEVPATLGSLDKVFVRVPQWALEERIGRLRRQLLLRVSLAGGAGLAVLGLAVVFIWHLVERNEQLERRRRRDEELAALGRLGANLAHEVRNPLNALSINLQLVAEDIVAEGSPRDTLALARREVDRLSKLVNDFLAYAREPVLAREPLAVAELLREIAALLAPACERAGIEVVVSGEAHLLGDRNQIHQAVVNLAQNACQAMEHAPVRRLHLRTVSRAGAVVIDVEDTGPGIQRDELPRVKEAFYSLRRGGTGLGLAIAERIVQAHGGRLDLENRAEGGLVARVVLPDGGNERV